MDNLTSDERFQIKQKTEQHTDRETNTHTHRLDDMTINRPD